MKVKRQPSEWEKIIANEATDKELNWRNHSFDQTELCWQSNDSAF